MVIHKKIIEATKIPHLLVSVIIFLITDTSIAQTTSFDAVLSAFGQSNLEEVGVELQKIDTTSLNQYDKATWFFYNADFQFKKDNQDLAFQSIIKSKDLFKLENAQSDVTDCNFLTISILAHQNNINNTNQIQKIIDEEHIKAIKTNDSTALSIIYKKIAVNFIDSNKGSESIKYFKKIIDIVKKQKDTLRVAYCYDNIGTVHSVVFNNPDSSLYYAKKTPSIYLKFKDYQSLSYNYNNQAEQYKLLKKYKKAIYYYKKADSIPLKKFKAKSKVLFYSNIADLYLQTKDYKNAALYLSKLNNLKDSINDTQQNIAISEIKEKFDNEKLRADNLESEAKRKQNKNLLYGSLILLLFGAITGLLILKNSKRKRLLAIKNKEIEQQKVVTLLKEQELTSIDSMITGQEKERKRIAEDLHDDLGSVLTTLKLHFENFKTNKVKKKFSEDELIDKTEDLLDEAYNKVRSISHAKNSGVIANQGLLLAVVNMAEKVSSSKKIEIDVIDHGLENRLENSLELTIFRIIQELITNIIKHAEAKHATIHLTNHDKSLNIMVEDDGKGFNTSKISKKGIGIHSIDKRIEHLDGTMTIESEINKGTTVIIDIPI